jgi:hypothetical protein
MENEIEFLKEKCLLLDFKTAIQGELMQHTAAIHEKQLEAANCEDCIRDIDKELKKLEAKKNKK